MPAVDPATSTVKGCQLKLIRNQGLESRVELTEQDLNNIYAFKSQVVLIGHKKFQVNDLDPSQYILVVSARLRKNIVEMDLFDRSEASQILANTINLLLGMRQPDLQYIILNSFEDIKEKCFFQSQELFLGKTIADLCMSDTIATQDALDNWEKNQNQLLGGSVIEELSSNDVMRMNAFKDANFYPKSLIIQ